MRLLACAALLLTFGCIARADIVFLEGVSNTGTDNVLFNDSATGSDIIDGEDFVRGHLQGTPTANCASGSLCVDVASDEELFVNNAGGGQATVEAVDGGYTLADIFLTIPPGGVFTKIVFALTGVGAGGEVEFGVEVTEGNGQTNQATFTTGSGNTFYTVVAINGQDIQSVKLTSVTGEFETLRQLRIGTTPVLVPPQGIPEPASVVLFGSLVAGLAMFRKRLGIAAS